MAGRKTDSMSKFKAGDVVKLKSGGTSMTVQGDGTTEGWVYCEWLSSDGKKQGSQFHPDMLELARS